jgi:hypothetical protein
MVLSLRQKTLIFFEYGVLKFGVMEMVVALNWYIRLVSF